MLQVVGTLSYRPKTRLTVEVDESFSNFYRALLPKSICYNKPRWPAHVTVVRSEKETPYNMCYWGKYEGQEVILGYGPYVYIANNYLWLNVWCEFLSDIRRELGLPSKSRWTRPPITPPQECFHLTIANLK